ncbi:MAG: 2-phosphosulfolactate phosphatase [Deinococcota bacterium]
MHLVVDLLPKDHYEDVVVVIDVLRTCTAAALLCANGLDELYVCSSVRSSHKFAKSRPKAQPPLLLLGERGGMPPEGFNYTNSPTELMQVDARDKAALLLSNNSPTVLRHTAAASHVLLGSLYNAEAVMRQAAALADTTIHLVCSGHLSNEDIGDILAAGFMAAMLSQVILPPAAGGQPQIDLDGTALMAMTMLKAFRDPLEALWHARAGQVLRQFDQASDVAFASYISQAEAVPHLTQVIPSQHADVYQFEVLR